MQLTSAITSGDVDKDTLLDRVAEKVADRVLRHGNGNGGNGNGNGNGKTVMGFNRNDIIRYTMMALFTAAGLIFAWYTAVNDSIANRPTVKQIEKMFEKHSGVPHKGSARDDVVRETSKLVRGIEKTQIKIQADVKYIGRGVDEIKREIKRGKRRKRSP